MYLTNMVAGSRIYTFEITAPSGGARHLAITEESQSAKGEKVDVRLTVSSEFVPIFTEMLNAANRFMSEHKVGEVAYPKTSSDDANQPPKGSTLEERRKAHPKAYAKWTLEEDAELKKLKLEGRSVKEISKILERNKGAINSRLGKLGLAE